MQGIVYGDKTCSMCGGNYFSKKATKDMKEHKLCFNCILKYHRHIFADENDMITIGEWKDANL